MNPLDNFLEHPPSLPIDPAVQEAIFQQTAALLPCRRRWPFALAAAAAVVLLLISSYFAMRAASRGPLPKHDVAENQPAPIPEPPQPPPQPEKPASAIVQAPAQPRDLEWQAFDAEDDRQRVRLYFRAGNVYLDQHQDYESALRCYHQALVYCNVRESEFDPADNWLVLALKHDHRKEK